MLKGLCVMTAPSFATRLSEIVDSFVSQRNTDQPVSIARLIRAARAAVPDLDLSDVTLSDLVARELVRCGADIDFDYGWPSAPASEAGAAPPREVPILRRSGVLDMRVRRTMRRRLH